MTGLIIRVVVIALSAVTIRTLVITSMNYQRNQRKQIYYKAPLDNQPIDVIMNSEQVRIINQKEIENEYR
tara:strand:+ start:657 stop:866 length:210 start_codon:yes stop_codon:yes gene_type:complete